MSNVLFRGKRKPVNHKERLMAKKNNNVVQGTLGEVIHYEWKGKQCMRSMPRKFKQTDASVKSGLSFGKASALSREIREDIAYVNPCKKDITVMFRLTGALNKFLSWKSKNAPVVNGILTGLPFISDFQFNTQCDLSNVPALKISAAINEPGILNVTQPAVDPQQTLGAHRFSNQVIWKLILIVGNLDTGKTEISDTATFNFPPNKIFEPPVLSMQTSKGANELVILIRAIQYSKGAVDLGRTEMITDLTKLPCAIVWAHCS
jgi:hypothetical protein